MTQYFDNGVPLPNEVVAVQVPSKRSQPAYPAAPTHVLTIRSPGSEPPSKQFAVGVAIAENGGSWYMALPCSAAGAGRP